MTSPINLTNRFVALFDVASPDLLESTATALLGVANADPFAGSGEGQYLASIAAEMRGRAWEQMAGVVK